MKKLFLLCFISFLLLPTFVAALELNQDYPKFGPFDINTNQSLPEIIGYVYYFIVGIAGLAAFVMLIWGGVQWVLSGAIPSQASEARDRIKSAILGLLLILASFLIVQVINPELTLVGGFGIPNADCKKEDPSNPISPCVKIKPGAAKAFVVNFTVNGEQSATVNSGDSVQLEWNLDPAFDRCEGRSFEGGLETSLWRIDVVSQGDRSRSSTVGPITNSPTFFILDCYKTGSPNPISAILSVGVSSGGPPEPLPTVDLKVDPDRSGPVEPSDGPLFVVPNEPFDFILFSVNAKECWGGPGVIINGDTQARVSRSVSSPPSQYTFIVTCFNNTGQSAVDKVIVNVSP